MRNVLIYTLVFLIIGILTTPFIILFVDGIAEWNLITKIYFTVSMYLVIGIVAWRVDDWVKKTLNNGK